MSCPSFSPLLQRLVLTAAVLSVAACGTHSNVPGGLGDPTASHKASQPEAQPTEAKPDQEAVAADVRVGSARLYEAAPKRGVQSNMGVLYSPPPATIMRLPSVEDRERYAPIRDGGVVAVVDQPFSTFSIDVDTGSYANMRRFLNGGRLPPPDAVRVEEMINYFPYQYAQPVVSVQGERPPFGVTTEVVASPWNGSNLLLRVGVKAFDVPRDKLPSANLVFLVDVSGSMNSPDKLPLLKKALGLVVEKLRPEDKVSLVTYADGTRVILKPTSGAEKAKIRSAIAELSAGGSTAGAAGIDLAYEMAQQGFVKDGINRILLATDGDFNVGITDFAQLKGMVEEKRKGGVSLSTLGFGNGNYQEELMEQLADVGDGNYSYIDTLIEAQKVLVDQASSTFSIVARDVKIQMEFNPAVVAEYRLIGYENRALAREDFRNDKVDAGEIGAGHTVTALYELTLVGSPGLLGPSRYKADGAAKNTVHGDELGVLRLRYKLPAGGEAREIATPVRKASVSASEDMRFAMAVAAFGQQLRGGKHLDKFGYKEIAALAAGARGDDPFGYRAEFVRLVKLANSLSTAPNSGSAPGSEDRGSLR